MMNKVTKSVKTYKQSVINTLPLLEQLIFEYAEKEGIVEIVDDVTDVQGVRA